MKTLILKYLPAIDKSYFSIFIIWLFHINGIFGILYWDKDWFLSNTPLNLGISFILLIWMLKEKNANAFLALSIAFLVGMVAEIIGVNTGIIFGDYWYGENLGFKVWGVPLFIGINWAVLTFILGSLSAYLFKNKFIAIIVGALLMVALDFIIEPSAPLFDFWYWKGDHIPMRNYIDWFLIGLIPQTAYHFLIKKKEVQYSMHLLAVQIIFFGTFFFTYG